MATSGGGSLTVWNVDQRRRVRTVGGDPPADPSPALVPFAVTADIGLFAVDPAGEHLAALTGVPGATAVVAWDLVEGREVFREDRQRRAGRSCVEPGR